MATTGVPSPRVARIPARPTHRVPVPKPPPKTRTSKPPRPERPTRIPIAARSGPLIATNTRVARPCSGEKRSIVPTSRALQMEDFHQIEPRLEGGQPVLPPTQTWRTFPRPRAQSVSTTCILGQAAVTLHAARKSAPATDRFAADSFASLAFRVHIRSRLIRRDEGIRTSRSVWQSADTIRNRPNASVNGRTRPSVYRERWKGGRRCEGFYGQPSRY